MLPGASSHADHPAVPRSWTPRRDRRTVVRRTFFDRLVQSRLFEERQKGDEPAGPTIVMVNSGPSSRAIGPLLARREGIVGVVVIVQREPQLLEIIGTLHATGRLASCLDGWKKQSDENADDGDHHQQFHQRKTGLLKTFHVIGSLN